MVLMRQSSVCWLGSLVGLIASSCLTSVGDLEHGRPDASAGSAGASGQGGSGGSGGGWADGTAGSGGIAGGTDASADAGGSGGQDADADAAPPIPGLIGHWPFDEGSGTTAVDVVGGANAVLPDDGATWTSAGAIGGAVLLSAPQNPIAVSKWAGSNFPLTGTVTVWVKSHFILNDTASRGIFDNWNGTRNHWYVRRANGSDQLVLQCALQVANMPYAFVKNTPVDPDVWQLVAIGWSPSSAFCYVHGTLDEGPVTPGSAPSDQLFTIGHHFDGSMDDLRLYDYLLTYQDLAKLLADGP
jgi:hypothetical protein